MSQFQDPVYARRTYEGVVQRVINSGTSEFGFFDLLIFLNLVLAEADRHALLRIATCCWYGTLHMTTRILAAICHRKGQRALVGKCNMDRNSAPDYQEESVRRSSLSI